MEVKRTSQVPSSAVEADRDTAMMLRHADEAEAFRAAAENPGMAAEAAAMDREFGRLDDESWPT